MPLWYAICFRLLNSGIDDLRPASDYSLAIMSGALDQPEGEDDVAARDRRMMLLALEQARAAAAVGEVPVGAVIYQGDVVLAAAFNLRESRRDPTAHAEILALREAALKLASWRMEGCSMAVTLEPCPMCAGALVNARMARLVYGADDPKMGAVRTLYELCSDGRFNHQVEIVADVEAAASAGLLKAFFQARRGADKPAKPGLG